MSEYADMAGGVMNRSSGHEIVMFSTRGVPRGNDENSSRIPPSSLYGFSVAFFGVLDVTGRSARSGPLSILNRSFSNARSVSAVVPTLARRSARSRSCSRMTEDDECGLEVMSLSKRRRVISRTTDRA